MMIYDSRALTWSEWLAEQETLIADGWTFPKLPMSGEPNLPVTGEVVYICKPRLDLPYKAPVVRTT